MKRPPSQAVFGDPLTGGFHCFPQLSRQGSHQAMPHKRLLCSTTFSKDSSLPSAGWRCSSAQRGPPVKAAIKIPQIFSAIFG